MQKFKVAAWPNDLADWKVNPAWESIISAEIEGDAYSQGVAQFRAYCDSHELQFEQFQIRSSSL